MRTGIFLFYSFYTCTSFNSWHIVGLQINVLGVCMDRWMNGVSKEAGIASVLARERQGVKER